MKRRDFFRNTATAITAGSLLTTLDSNAAIRSPAFLKKGKVAKNNIFLVSDGMSNGTLTVADVLSYRKEGTQSRWLQL